MDPAAHCCRSARANKSEARWLREAERYRIWRKLGFSTALEYLEDMFGHAPRTAKERLRVANALGELPGLDAQLREGALSYSAVRELSRVMTPATEAQWLACARGRNVRDIEQLVEGRKKGDLPSDPRDPALMTCDVVFTLDTRRQALLQQARAMFEAERGEHIDNADLLEALCMCALQTGAASVGAVSVGAAQIGETMTGETMTGARNQGATKPSTAKRSKAPRPAHQIVIRKCDDCTRASMLGRGSFIEIPSSDLQMLRLVQWHVCASARRHIGEAA